MPGQNDMSKLTLLSAIALGLTNGLAWAQNNDFQLPRECSERHNVDQSKCVIQDGPPRDPWVHKVNQPKPTTVLPNPTPATPPSTLAPRRNTSK